MKKVDIFCTMLIVLLNYFKSSRAIDCFKCMSENKNNPKCEDPFHNNYTTDILQTPCMGGRKGRNGVFPATACIKITGIFDDNKETITVRSCALDSGTLTTDTELVRTSHCGGFFYESRYVRGCIQSCSDADACNASEKICIRLLNYLALFHTFIKILFG
ncbi:uncharacterized protein LOC109538445 [Dendroctonus ponderosae]|uniref:uncharacterized protein LOC109538445 n=1 Tax=Dendroctonus ponderosae TaxID=77166 RepID=UPI0020352F99|nr:uncharacterized protein LOC109538445 [Dendroctonus ponderosae]